MNTRAFWLYCVLLLVACVSLSRAASGTWTGPGISSGTWISTDDGGGDWHVSFSGTYTRAANKFFGGFYVGTNPPDYEDDKFLGWYGPDGTSPQAFSGINADASGASATFYFFRETAHGEDPSTWETSSVTISAPAGSYKMNVNLKNTTLSSIDIHVWQDGEDVSGLVSVPAESTYVYNLVTTIPDLVEIHRTVPMVSYTGASFIAGSESYDTVLSSFSVPAWVSGPVANWYVVVGGPGGVLENQLKSVWNLGDSTLNGNVYREGTDKIVGAINVVATALTSGGGGGGGDASAANQIAGNVIAANILGATEEIRDLAEQAEGRRLTAITDAAAAVSAATTAGATASTAARALFATAPSALGYTPVAAGSAPLLSVTFPAAFGGAVFDLNPFSEGRLGGVATWFRQAMAWLTIVLLGAWVWKQVSWTAYVANSAQQAKGNPIVAGTGAQGTAFIAAGVMTVAVMAMMTALVAWSFNDINLSVFVTTAGSNPLTGMASGALWMLDRMWPVATMITAVVARMTFHMYSTPLWVGCLAVCRFVVP